MGDIEVLLLFVWTREDEWSSELANDCRVDKPKVALRSVCADSTEARSLLASGTPRVDEIPALVMVEKTGANQRTSVVYGQEAIIALLIPLGIRV